MKTKLALILSMLFFSWINAEAQNKLSKEDSLKISQFNRIDALRYDEDSDTYYYRSSGSSEISSIIKEVGRDLRMFLSDFESDAQNKEYIRQTKEDFRSILQSIKAEGDSVWKYMNSDEFQQKLAEYDLAWKRSTQSDEIIRFNTHVRRAVSLKYANKEDLKAFKLSESKQKPEFTLLTFDAKRKEGEIAIEVQTSNKSAISFVIFNSGGEQIYQAMQQSSSQKYKHAIDISTLKPGDYILGVGESDRYQYNKLIIN